MIDIAIVTTAINQRRTARRESDAESVEVRKGSIWVRRNDKIRRHCLECLTANGVRLELESFFERFSGRSFRLQVIQPTSFDPTIAKAVVSLVPAPIFDAPHSYKQFTGNRDLAGDRWRFTPFDYGHAGRLHKTFVAPWAPPPEPMILLKSSAGDHYTYPSTIDDEENETADQRNGRMGGLKRIENLKAKQNK